MRLFTSIGIILLVLVLQSHCQQDPDLTVGPTKENLDLVSKSVTNLAHKISLAIASPKSKTELFSPVSIAGALSLLLLGSGGATRDELTELLGFKGQPITFTDIHKSFGWLFKELVSNEPSMKTKIPWRENDKCNNPDYDEEDEPSYQPSKSSSNSRGKRDTDSHYISVANGVFLDNNLQLNPNYEKLTKTLYAGEISRKPLLSNPVQSSHEINSWVKYATRNKILEIVSPEQVTNAPMVLASALYFKAKWETMFIEPDTRPRPFYINGRESPPIDIYTMATSGCFPFYEEKQLDVKMIGLPYQEGKSTMYIIIPNQSDRQRIRTLQAKVNVGQFNELIDRMVVKTGTILLPKMKLDNTLGLKDVLVVQGLEKIFNPYLSNLTEITKNGRIFGVDNRRGQPTSTSTPMPITQKPASPKPRPTTNTHDAHLVPSAGPGNSASPKPIPTTQPTHTPDMNQHEVSAFPGNPSSPRSPSATQPTHNPIVITINENDCLSTNNCFYKENTCYCYPDQPIIRDSRGCYPRPLIIFRDCPQERQVYKEWPLCRAFSYYTENINGGQCAQNCEQSGDSCNCCKPYVPQPTQQPAMPSPSIDYQQNSNTPNTFEVANRFNSNAAPPPSVSTQRPVVCRNYRKCDAFNYCYYYQQCALVNRDAIPHAVNYGRRNKRQTQNNSSPPNLYVGDVLHKVTLDINEQGTEGGAVTAVVIDRISASFNLRVDGPFLIYLRNDITKLPLFYGAVFDPRS